MPACVQPEVPVSFVGTKLHPYNRSTWFSKQELKLLHCPISAVSFLCPWSLPFHQVWGSARIFQRLRTLSTPCYTQRLYYILVLRKNHRHGIFRQTKKSAARHIRLIDFGGSKYVPKTHVHVPHAVITCVAMKCFTKILLFKNWGQ